MKDSEIYYCNDCSILTEEELEDYLDSLYYIKVDDIKVGARNINIIVKTVKRLERILMKDKDLKIETFLVG
ncbi:MAG: hypothetical protein ACFFG0_29510, partial [Candidatus Thorarchaeota archaeon]